MSTQPVVEARGLTRRFREVTRRARTSTSRSSPDAIHGLLGRNGAGKTTLMQLLTGQDLPTSGQVRLFGEDPYENPDVLARTCFVAEGQTYPDAYRVCHVVAAARLLHPRWDEAFARQLLAEYDLPLGRRVRKLSRGMRSALGVVVGLASRAELTLFDEPYLGLDAVARQLFYDRLLADFAEHPRTVVLSTHLIDEVGRPARARRRGRPRPGAGRRGRGRAARRGDRGQRTVRGGGRGRQRTPGAALRADGRPRPGHAAHPGRGRRPRRRPERPA